MQRLLVATIHFHSFCGAFLPKKDGSGTCATILNRTFEVYEVSARYLDVILVRQVRILRVWTLCLTHTLGAAKLKRQATVAKQRHAWVGAPVAATTVLVLEELVELYMLVCRLYILLLESS